MQRESRAPGYVGLAHAGALEARAAAARELLEPCRLCPRECRARRRHGKVGTCGVAGTALVSSAGPHFAEERPLVGRGGSGTIFFAGCNLGCTGAACCDSGTVTCRRKQRRCSG